MKLAILSVNYKSEFYLINNLLYIQKYNPKLNFDWFVVNNESNGIPLDDKFILIPGVPKVSEVEANKTGVQAGSIHHADALNKGLSYIDIEKYDYLLLLDPDFFIVQSINKIMINMFEQDLAFYGASYSMPNKPMIRDFPVAYCLFIDTKKVDCKALDLGAGFNEEELDKYDYYPDVGHRLYREFKKSDSLKYRVINYDPFFEEKVDYFPNLGLHLRMKIHRHMDKRQGEHRIIISKLFNGSFRDYEDKINHGKFNIRRTEIQDAKQISKLRHDPTIYLNIHTPLLYPTHNVEEWIKNLGNDCQRFTILDTQAKEPENLVGLIRIDHLDLHNNTCYIGLDIGEKYRGKGLARLFYKWLFSYLFNSVGIRILYLEVLEDNTLAKELYNKIGFKECGRFPQKTYNRSRYQDSIIMFLTRESWQCQNESLSQVEQASLGHT